MEIKIEKRHRCAECGGSIPENTQIVRNYINGVLWFCSLECLKRFDEK